MHSKKELLGLFSKYRIRPLRRLGQNFLIDRTAKDRIIESAALAKDDVVLEIGPGFGALTFDLAARAKSVIAVEKDKSLCRFLEEEARRRAADVRVVQGDIVDFDISAVAPSRKIKVIGNLPYYVTTPILTHLVEGRRSIECAVITVQKEVAERLTALPGGKTYGALTCFVQYHAEVRPLCRIDRTSFYPEPEVDSSLIRLDVRGSPPVDVRDEELFFRVIRKAFNQRRKTILNSLTSKALGDIGSREAVSETLSKVSIDTRVRPEMLSLQDFANIANALTP